MTNTTAPPMRSFVSFMFAISLLSEIIFRAGWYD